MNSIAQAAKLAHYLFTNGRVRAIYLFGSVAREGIGHDIDLVVVVSVGLADRYIEATDYDQPRSRLECITQAEQILDFDLHRVATILEGGELPDLILVPPRWRHRLEELQAKIFHPDPMFVFNIARDARRYDPEYQMFAPVREPVWPVKGRRD